MNDANFPVELHRLNRLEYDRSLADLLGSTKSYAADFPPDAATSGFDNVAHGLRMSPALFDLYFQKAREVVEDTMVRRPRVQLLWAADEGGNAGYPVGTSAYALHGSIWEVTFGVAELSHLRIVVPLSGMQTGSAPIPTFRLTVDGAEVHAGDVSGTPTNPHEYVVEEDFPIGKHVLRVEPTNFMNDGLTNSNNEVIVHAASAESRETFPRLAEKKLISCELSDPECAPRVLFDLARRAYRRPLEESEKDALGALYDELRLSEEDNQAMLLVSRAILSSSKFLYRSVRLKDIDENGQLSGFALASRLSYFLWSSLPDEALLLAASKGDLGTDVGLREQVGRMLSDPRASALVDGFAEQWLSVRLLRHSAPSKELFPEFSEDIREAMIAETKLLFAEFLKAPHPLATLANPDFGFRNDALAKFYGESIPGSSTMKRIALAGNDRRGLVELGAWLTAQSEPEHTSPIRRGRWILDAVTCTPVPPPPAAVVPELPKAENLTTRERLALHRTEKTCANCHKLLDPAGLGFEQFDAVGRRRSSENNLPIDTSGAIGDELTFSDPRDLGVQLEGSDLLTNCLTKKLSVYAMGREMTQGDQTYIEEIQAQLAGTRGTLKDLIIAIVLSKNFRTVRESSGTP